LLAEPRGFGFYSKHLAFWGTVCFIHDLVHDGGRGNRVILLSEWGEEMLGSRTAFLDEVRCVLRPLGGMYAQQAAGIHLADVGTRVDLCTGRLLCEYGGDVCDRKATQSFEAEMYAGDTARPHRRWGDRRIIHLCAKHATYTDEGRSTCWPLIGEFTHVRKA